MGEADELEGQRVEAHELGGDGVDGDLVGAGQDEVLHVRAHGARARAVAGDGAVHDSEDAGVDLLLDRQEVDQRLVDDGVGPVAAVAQEAAEGVLHRAGHGGEDVGLQGRQVDDVLADEGLRVS